MRTLLPLPLLLALLSPLAAAAPFPVTATPDKVVLGRDKGVLVEVKVPRGTPPPRAVASTGSLLPLPSPTGDVYAYRWLPPDIRYPLLAVLAFWVDSSEGPPEVTTVHIPLLGRTNLGVDTNVGAGAQVVVQVGEQRFGPARTNRKGKAVVPVEVPPGVRSAKVLVTAKRQQTHQTARLDVPPERPLVALVSPAVLPVDGGGWLLLLSESPLARSVVELRVQGGTVEEAQAPGVFRVKPEPGASAVVVDAHHKDGTGAARLTVPVSAPIVATVSAPQPPAEPPPAQPPVVAAPVAPAPLPPLDWKKHLSFTGMAGGFFAGGDNLGPLLSVGAGYRLPLLDGRLAVEVELGVRQSATHPLVEPLGELDARVVALPLLLSGRVLAYERGPLSLYGRAGAGAAFFEHRTTNPLFQNPSTQQGRTFMGFLAAQGTWRFGQKLSALLELRGSYAPARALQLEAQLGGLSASAGVRYDL